MINRITLLMIILCGLVVPITAQIGDDDCAVDLTTVNALLDDANALLDAGNTDDALALLAIAEADLEAILARCTDKDVAEDMITPVDFDLSTLELSEVAVLRRVFETGDVLLRFPAEWTVEIGDGQIIFANDATAIDAEAPEAHHLVGVMTALTAEQVSRYGVEAAFTAADAIEVLGLAFVGAYDDASLGSAVSITGVDGAVLAGTVVVDDLSAQITLALVRVDAGYALLVLTAFDEAVDAAALLTRLAETVVFVPDEAAETNQADDG